MFSPWIIQVSHLEFKLLDTFFSSLFWHSLVLFKKSEIEVELFSRATLARIQNTMQIWKDVSFPIHCSLQDHFICGQKQEDQYLSHTMQTNCPLLFNEKETKLILLCTFIQIKMFFKPLGQKTSLEEYCRIAWHLFLYENINSNLPVYGFLSYFVHNQAIE